MRKINNEIKVGDKVKLNIYIKEFRWGRGGVGYDEIGKITGIDEDGKIYVVFPSCDCYWAGLESELVKVGFSLKRDDLQFADIVTLRDDNKYVIADGCLYGEDNGYYEDCERIYNDYNNNLIYCYDEKRHDLDIMKVERNGEVIFQRESETKEMTIAEISKALGYEVKIVKEND